MNRFTPKSAWIVAAIVVVSALLIDLQSGSQADEAISPRNERGGNSQPREIDSAELPFFDSAAQAGVRRLPPTSRDPQIIKTGSAPLNPRTAHFTRAETEQGPAYDKRVSPASWNDGSAETTRSSQPGGEAGVNSVAVSASLPRTADDGHVYENDLPSPNKSAPVSLHLNEVSVRQALEMLSRSHNINMLVAPGVTGSVTANLEGLESDTALNAILKLCNLVAHRENGLIYIYANAEYPQIDFQVRTFPLDYVSGTDVLPVISSLLSASGQAFATQIDSLDNTKTREAIAIIDMPRVIQRAAEYIHQIDVPPLQVMIEAHVLQVNLDEDCRHGINYNHVMDALGSGGIELNVVGFADPLATPGVFARLASHDVGALLEFLKTTTDSKTLASPRVMVINGQTAKIQVGEQIPYTVVTFTDTASVEEVRFLDVGVVLEVTPRISHNGLVMMRVKPKVSEGKYSPQSDLPGEVTREVESDVLIRDGEGLVIGGLIQERFSDVQRKIPWLGDLHYIGRLFQRRERIKVRSEVVITLIPRIQYAGGHSERDLIDAERSQTPLLHGPLEPVYRPWEAILPDAVNNPVTLPRVYGGRCQNCASDPGACPAHGNSIGPEKPLQPFEPSQPAVPTEAGPGESPVPPPVPTESARFVAPPRYAEQDYLSPPTVLVEP